MENTNDREKRGFYDPAYTLEEVADLINQEMGQGVEDELSAVRVALRRALLRMEAEMDPAEFAKTTSLIFRGSTTVANLLRTRRAISGEAADSLIGAFATVLQEVKVEQDWRI